MRTSWWNVGLMQYSTSPSSATSLSVCLLWWLSPLQLCYPLTSKVIWKEMKGHLGTQHSVTFVPSKYDGHCRHICWSRHIPMNFCTKSFAHVSVKIMDRKQNHQPLYEITEAVPARPHEIFFRNREARLACCSLWMLEVINHVFINGPPLHVGPYKKFVSLFLTCFLIWHFLAFHVLIGLLSLYSPTKYFFSHSCTICLSSFMQMLLAVWTCLFRCACVAIPPQAHLYGCACVDACLHVPVQMCLCRHASADAPVWTCICGCSHVDMPL